MGDIQSGNWKWSKLKIGWPWGSTLGFRTMIFPFAPKKRIIQPCAFPAFGAIRNQWLVWLLQSVTQNDPQWDGVGGETEDSGFFQPESGPKIGEM